MCRMKDIVSEAWHRVPTNQSSSLSFGFDRELFDVIFQNTDEEIRDQVIEKCRSHKIRTKLLIKGHDLTLDQLRTIATTVEMTDKQVKEMDSGTHVNVVQRRHERYDKTVQHGGKGTEPVAPRGKCYRCGRPGHFAKDKDCPARSRECNKCGYSGHFASCCKTKHGATASKKDSYSKSYDEEINKQMDQGKFKTGIPQKRPSGHGKSAYSEHGEYRQ